mgnify:CR=1 FL=1
MIIGICSISITDWLELSILLQSHTVPSRFTQLRMPHLFMAMISSLFIFAFIICFGIGAVSGPWKTSSRVHAVPGSYLEDAHAAIRRGLVAASLDRRDEFRGIQNMEKSWSGATLLSVYAIVLASFSKHL